MNKVVKDLWINELRSREYRQGRGVLKSGDRDGTMKHCCLGVLCEIHNVLFPEWKWIQVEDQYEGHYTHVYRYVKDGTSGSNALLPLEVAEWAGFGEQSNPRVYDDQPLSGLNDDGMSFDEIAELIDKNL